MIGGVNQRRVEFLFLPLEQGNRLCQEMIGVEQRVVVGINDGLTRAFAKVCRFADRFKATKRRWKTLVIGRAVVAQLVQDKHQITVCLRQHRFQAMQENFVKTLFSVAKAGLVLLIQLLQLDTGTGHPTDGLGLVCSRPGCRAR